MKVGKNQSIAKVKPGDAITADGYNQIVEMVNRMASGRSDAEIVVGGMTLQRKTSRKGGTLTVKPVWELWTQTTGGNASTGSFELIVTHPDPDNEGEDKETIIDVDWDATAEDLQNDLNALNGVQNVEVSRGPLNTKNLIVSLGNKGMKDLEIGINDLTSARPYLLYKRLGEE